MKSQHGPWLTLPCMLTILLGFYTILRSRFLRLSSFVYKNPESLTRPEWPLNTLLPDLRPLVWPNTFVAILESYSKRRSLACKTKIRLHFQEYYLGVN
jgi:hypothetical protein